MNTPWEFQGKPFDPSADWLKEHYGDMVGFTYSIANSREEKFYYGSKMIWENRKLKPLKGRTRSRRKIYETDWRKYKGSSDDLKADIERLGIENFQFMMLQFWKTKAMLKYQEMKLIFFNDAVLEPYYYNKYVEIKLNSNQLGVTK